MECLSKNFILASQRNAQVSETKHKRIANEIFHRFSNKISVSKKNVKVQYVYAKSQDV